MQTQALLALVLFLGGCVTDARTRKLTLEDELIDADRAFAADVQQRRLEGWVAAFAEHGSQMNEEGAVITGEAAIRAYMQGAFDDPGFQLDWAPVEAVVPEEGNLGFVWGRWTMRRPGAPEVQGHYLDIWKRGADGEWKVLFDVGEDAKAAR